MRFEPVEFRNAGWNSYEQSPCSPPEPDIDWRGVVIRAPASVFYKPAAPVAIPICGYYMVELANLPQGSTLTLVVQNEATGLRMVGAVVEYDPSPEVPPPPAEPVAPEDLEGLATGRFFNVNLLDFVKMPVAPGTYRVEAYYGNARSNRVTVRLAFE